MPSRWANRAISRLKPHLTAGAPSATGLPDGSAARWRLFWGVAAFGLGLAAQFALTSGQPLLGGLGLAIAVALFVASMRPFLVEIPPSHPDDRAVQPQAGEILQDQVRQRPSPPLPSGASDLRGRVAYVKHNWRELTIAEILSGSMPLLPREPEATPTTSGAECAPSPPATEAGEPPKVSPRRSGPTTQIGVSEQNHTGRRRAIGLVLLALAVTSSVVALVLFNSDQQARYAWTVYLASLLLFLAALDRLFGEPDKDIRSLPLSRSLILPGLIILALAIAMRLVLLDSIPFGTWWDEADIGIKALQLLQAPGSGLVSIDYHPNALHYPFFVSLAFRLLGIGTLSVRAVSVAFGLATVVVAFLAGREARGTRFGLLLAFFVAIARWHVTFSRLGMSTITSPFFALLAIFFLLRARRTQSLPDFAAAGLTVGLGLGFHASFRLFPLVVLVFLGWRSIARWSRRPQPGGQRLTWAASLAIFILGAGLAAAPVAQYALRNPDGFTARTNDVSIFTQRDEPNLARAIGSNTAKHLLMFNYQGDPNGRHNLPGAPLLDPISGVLFVLGLGLALSRLRDPANLLFVVLFFTGLVPAILTVDFEAPQAQRAVLAMPAVLYFSALAVETLWRSLDRSQLSSAAHRGGVAVLFLAGGLMVTLNAHTYFVRQATNVQAWDAHNAAETLAARQIQELEPDHTTIYLSEQLYGERVLQFLVPQARDSRVLLPAQALPFCEPSDKTVVILVKQGEAQIIDEILHYYPQAEQIESLNPDGQPALYTIIIPPEQIQYLQGLEAHYWPGNAPEGDPLVTRIEHTLDADWPGAAPLSPPFTAAWDTILYVPEFGEYEFALHSPAEATVWLDLLPLVSSEESGERHAKRTLAQGKYRLRLRAASGPGALRLSWRKAQDAPFETIPAWYFYQPSLVANNGLLGTYYAGANRESSPALMRIEPQIDRYIHRLPLERPYAVDWTGAIQVPSTGEYTFALRVRGQAQLLIDEQVVLDVLDSEVLAEDTLYLEAGWHALRVQFLDHLSNSEIHLYWTPPGAQQEIVPSDVLSPVGQAARP